MKSKLQCSRDTSVNQWIFPSENRDVGSFNYGGSEELKSNGTFNVPVFDFDLSSLKGKKVTKAYLYLKYVDHPIEKYEISTITSPWQEGTGNGKDNPKDDWLLMEGILLFREWA